MDEKLPAQLYAYRLFCMGCTLKVLSVHPNVVALFHDILDHEDDGVIVFHGLRKDGECVDVPVRPSAIIAADPMEDLPYDPNREARRREDAERRNLGVGVGGRVQIGQQAKKDK